ncbi:hypothetical protein BKA57DRAFT_113333 [Linnemannia elongata]|nr:hypothetical protein BKA57DRAFT_113333 [Linnemannia elongata]
MAVSVWGWVWGLCTIEIAWCGCGTIRKEEVGKKEKEGKRKEGKKKKEKLDISFESLMRFSGQVYLSLSLSLSLSLLWVSVLRLSGGEVSVKKVEASQFFDPPSTNNQRCRIITLYLYLAIVKKKKKG